MPGSFRFEPCPNCCVTGCVYFSDAFDRADSTSLGVDWTETAGDWSISTNRLAISSASAKATCNTTHPTSSTKYIVSVSVTLGTDGDVARVWVNNSGQFAELERITSTCGRLRLYDGSTCNGSCNVALGGFTRLVLCVEASKIHVGTGGSPMLTIPATATSSVVAVGTGGTCTGNVYFEDFSLSKHSVDDSTCPACGDEGCTWFADNGCASGSLSAADWITTGTWAYSNAPGFTSIECTADGEAVVAPSDPFDPRSRVQVGFYPLPNLADLTIRVHYDSDDTTYAQIKILSSGMFRVEQTAVSGGVQYGPTLYSAVLISGVYVRLCYDGTSMTVQLVHLSGSETISIPHTPAACTPRIVVSGLSGGNAVRCVVWCSKSAVDIAGCPGCGTSDCEHCQAGTFANHATVTIANITSNSYGCTCTDQTIDLYATASGCQWTGTKTGPCSSGTWTATATITAVTGGYKLTVALTTTGGGTATFENTVLSGSPVDCLTAFDGDVPRVSSGGAAAPCTFPSATCTFATP